jgi:hypothetical protein
VEAKLSIVLDNSCNFFVSIHVGLLLSEHLSGDLCAAERALSLGFNMF